MKFPAILPRVVLLLAFLAVILFYMLFATAQLAAIYRAWTDPHATITAAIRGLPEGDFARFWYVGKLLVWQRLNDFGFPQTPSPWFIKTFQINILASSGNLRENWLYPPTMNILGMVFSFLPLPLSFLAWNGASVLATTLLLRRAGLDGWSLALGLISPAAIQNYYMGQNGILTGGLMMAALLWASPRPVRAGALAGLLCIKPQLGLLFPAIFLARFYRAGLVTGFLTVILLVGASILLEGWQAWAWFLKLTGRSSTTVLQTSFTHDFLAAGATVFFMARSFHASLILAYALQATASLVSFGLIHWLWRAPYGQNIQRVALTVCLASFLSPYGYFYDLTGYSIAMAAMLVRAPVHIKPVYAVLWLCPGYAALIAASTHHIYMPACAGLAAFTVWRDMNTPPAAPPTLLHAHNQA